MSTKTSTFLQSKFYAAKRFVKASDFYWETLNRAQRLWFRILRRSYYSAVWTENKKQDLKVGSAIFRGGIYSTIIAVALFIVTELSEAFIERHFSALHDIACEFTAAALSYLNISFYYNSDAVSGLLGSISAVSGAFLGLYFTAVSIGAGQQLGSMTYALRTLVVSERFGNKYIGYLTILTLFSFLLWLKTAVVGAVTLLSLFLVTSMAIFLIAGFYPLGKRSFNLAEPSNLVEPLFFDIYQYFKKLRKRDLFSSYGPIETHFRKSVREKIANVDQVVKLALEKGERGAEDVKLLLNKLIGMLLNYHQFKENISTESKWFGSVLKHENWLSPDSSKEQLLHNLGVVAQPSVIADRNWLEREVNVLVTDVLKSYVKEQRADSLVSLIGALQIYLNSLVTEWDAEHAIEQYHVFSDAIIPILKAKEIDLLQKLQIIDLLELCRIDIAIHSLACVTNFEAENELDNISKFVFGETKVLAKSVPKNARTIIEHFVKVISLEKSVEGKFITPKWFIKQVIARAYTIEFRELISRMVDFVDKSLSSETSYELALCMAARKQREFELVKRIDVLRHEFQEKIRALQRFQTIDDFKIELLPDNFEQARLDDLLRIQLDSLSNVLIPIFKPVRDTDLPDYFGVCFRILVNQLFIRIEKNDANGFSNLFPKLFLAAMLAKDRQVKDFKGYTDEVAKFRLAFDPLIDVLHLSGYAVALSEAFGSPIFSSKVFELWSSFTTTDLDNPEKVLNWVLNIHRLSRNDFRMTPGYHLRFSWKSSFENFLRTRNFIHKSPFGSLDSQGQEVPNGPILRAICDGGFNPNEAPTEWFIVSFMLNKSIPSESVDLSQVGFWNAYQRSEERSNDPGT